MVIGLLFLAGIPTSIGAVTAISRSGDPEDPRRDEIRGEEVHLTVYCAAPSPKRRRVHGKSVLLKDGKVIVGNLPKSTEYTTKGHPFQGFFIGYPDGSNPPIRGLVSKSSVDPPAMGWLYVDKETMEIKYGNKTTSLPHIHGPWDMTEDDEGILLEDQELIVAVEEQKGQWALYFDRNGDGTGLPINKMILPVSLERKPKEMLDHAI